MIVVTREMGFARDISDRVVFFDPGHNEAARARNRRAAFVVTGLPLSSIP